MNLDFPRLDSYKDQIIVRPGDDAFGPYGFKVSGALPTGVTLTDASATAYLYANDSYTEKSDLIEPESVNVVGDYTVQVKFQGKNSEGNAHVNGSYYLKLKTTLSNSGVKTFVAGPIIVESF